MKTIWDAARQREIHDRIARLRWDSQARWGSFTAPKMVCHLADSLKMALGVLPVQERKLPLRYPLLKQFVIYLAPFPKSAPTAPELLARQPQEWNADVGDLRSLVDRVTARGPEARWVDHPAFGRLSPRAWGVLIYRHMDHHLRQFGV
jgi:uncharacterized protein DUF1569